MRPLRYSINVTLDGCCDHRVMLPDEELHRHAIENLERADALLFGRVTYQMMEEAWRPAAGAGARPEWMEPFARTISAARNASMARRTGRWAALRGDVRLDDVGNVFRCKGRTVMGPLPAGQSAPSRTGYARMDWTGAQQAGAALRLQ